MIVVRCFGFGRVLLVCCLAFDSDVVVCLVVLGVGVRRFVDACVCVSSLLFALICFVFGLVVLLLLFGLRLFAVFGFVGYCLILVVGCLICCGVALLPTVGDCCYIAAYLLIDGVFRLIWIVLL